jgi:hypothetical protein
MYIYCFYDNPRRLVLEIVPRKKGTLWWNHIITKRNSESAAWSNKFNLKKKPKGCW